MRAAVFNRYWPTGGGGEKYAGTVAQTLAQRFDTDLLGVGHLDLSWLAERLQLDLSGTGYREVEDSPTAVTTASADYDLFVNVSYMSADPSEARHSIYVVMFPTRFDAHWSRAHRFAVDHVAPLKRSVDVRMTWGTGFHHQESGRRRIAWTDGQGVLRFSAPRHHPVPVELTIGRHRPLATLPARVGVEVDGQLVAQATLEAPRSRLDAHRPLGLQFEVPTGRGGGDVEVRLVSDTFVPSEVGASDDHRTLGVPLLGITVGGAGMRRLGRLLPGLVTPRQSRGWLDTYSRTVAISEYTREWVSRWWDLDPEVLYPPVTMHRQGEKVNSILNVGRFFDADRGHSKKQLELVRAFRSLCDRGVSGWTLNLAGGCAAADAHYLERVRDEAAGYPVEFHIDVGGSQLADLFSTSKVYWHASGLGEDARRHPDRMEHFGITTVEAMSAGAVPVVIGVAGQLETVRHGVDGFHFRSLDGLVDLTHRLVRDDQLRIKMGAAGVERARQFSTTAFADHLDQMVADIFGEATPVASATDEAS